MVTVPRPRGDPAGVIPVSADVQAERGELPRGVQRLRLDRTGVDWAYPVDDTISVSLKAGENTIKFYNDSAYAPDLSEVTVSS